MATTGPSTPDNTPRKMAGVSTGISTSTGMAGRSFSQPTRMRGNPSTPAAAIGEAAGIETLYANPNGKVVKFNCASRSRPSSSAGGPQPGPATGSLPWATLTEQTLASGPLEIYRVPGSVSFLHSGSLLHAIMPRSNCWCVDGVSKFAMRVLTDTYYRIELPGETEEELARVEEFKATLKKVLFYERTACPFARTFEVPLPEEQVTRKRRNTAHGPAKKWKLDRAYSWKPQDGREPPQLSTSEEEESASLSEEDVDNNEAGGEAEAEAASMPEDVEPELEDEVKELKITTPTRPTVRDRVKGLTMRSVTAPPHLSLHSTPPSRLRTSVLVSGVAAVAGPQMADVDPPKLPTFQAMPTDMPPSPPDSSAGFEPMEQYAPSDEVAIASSESPCHNARVEKHLEKSSSSPSDVLEPDLQPGADWQESDADADADTPSTLAQPHLQDTFVNAENVTPRAHNPNEATPPTIADPKGDILDRAAPLPPVPQIPDAEPALPNQTSQLTSVQDPIPQIDPFAQIQARIQARRSIGGTTTSGFAPQPRQTSTSTQGASPPNPQRPGASSTRTLSHKSSSISRHSSQQQQYLATALVKKACSVFLGPPAHLVVLMLRIAARFAKGVFPKSLLYESPKGERRRVPGSFDLDESDDDYGLSEDDETSATEEWEEDDFGVPLSSPVRLSEGLRERVRVS